MERNAQALELMYGSYERALDYDIEYSDRQYKADIVFWTTLAKDLNASSVLELGAGTGRLSIPMAQSGFKVVGLDLMEPMIRVAREKVENLKSSVVFDNLELQKVDMRSFQLGRKFDLALIGLNSFGHLLSREDQDSFFRSVSAHLEEGGRLGIDMFNIDYLLEQGEIGKDRPSEWTPSPVLNTVDVKTPDGKVYWRENSDYFVPSEGLLHGVRITSIYDENNGGLLDRRYLKDFDLKVSSGADLERLYEENGLEVESVYGNYDFSAYHPISRRIIVIGKNK